MVGDDQHDRVVAQELEDLADLVVEVAVIVVDRVAERAIGLVQDVLRVVILPEPVVDPVQPDVDEVEIVPLLGLRAGAARPGTACGSWRRSRRGARPCRRCGIPATSTG